MKIGIPKGLLYYRYETLWKTFFSELGIDYIVSPDTNKEIMNRGNSLAIDEACLSSKVYLGHVDYLIDKCDYILVPRISDLGKQGTVCTKFKAIYDVVANTFREQDIKLLYYNIDLKSLDIESKAFVTMGKFLGHKKSNCLKAYLIAKQAQKSTDIMDIKLQEQSLNTDKLKILIVAHDYNIYDKYFGKPIINYLEEIDVVPVYAEIANKEDVLARSKEISETLPWAYSKELFGAVAIYREQIDGIILISSFNCGPDSMANDILIRRVKDKPILNLIVDGQEGSAGVETRLESFLDIIRFKREDLDVRI